MKRLFILCINHLNAQCRQVGEVTTPTHPPSSQCRGIEHQPLWMTVQHNRHRFYFLWTQLWHFHGPSAWTTSARTFTGSWTPYFTLPPLLCSFPSSRACVLCHTNRTHQPLHTNHTYPRRLFWIFKRANIHNGTSEQRIKHNSSHMFATEIVMAYLQSDSKEPPWCMHG